MSGFEEYPEYEKEMYIDYARWCNMNGKFSHWYSDGRYKKQWNRHSEEKDFGDKAMSEDVAYEWWRKQNKIKMEEESNERNENHNLHWNHRVAERKNQQEIDAAIRLLARNGMKVVLR